MTLFNEHFEGTANPFDALAELGTSGYVSILAAVVQDLLGEGRRSSLAIMEALERC